MRARNLIYLAGALLVGGAVASAVLMKGAERHVVETEVPGEPYIDVISPRDGSKPEDNSVVVKVRVHNFKLAPAKFGEAPELGEGHIRFSLNKTPEDVDESELEEAATNPIGSGKVVGRSFDLPQYSGPNGTLAERIGSAEKYSPATLPEIYYHSLPVGLYRLVITLARNDGTSTGFHGVTHFRVE
ncbi:MAG: hypothetical protein AABM29_02870 [Actinomycetota bacterium]